MNRIRELRQKKELSQEELARLLGVDRSAVAKWETGGNFPRAENMIAMARLFGCSLDEMMSTGIDMNNQPAADKDTSNKASNCLSCRK